MSFSLPARVHNNKVIYPGMACPESAHSTFQKQEVLSKAFGESGAIIAYFRKKKRFSLVESQHKKGHMKHMKHYLGATYSIKRGHRRLKVKKVLLFFLLCKKPTAHHIKSSLCACVHTVSALTHLCRMTPDTRRTAAIAD